MNNIQSNIVNLFPTPVGIYTFPREFTQEELIFVRDLEKAKNMGNLKSKNEHILETPETRAVCDYTRISLIFNTFPVGNLGEVEDLTGLVL